MCFGLSKEPSHGNGSFEYPQHMFGLGKREMNFKYTLFSGGLLDVLFHRFGVVKVATQYFIYSVYRGGLKMVFISRCIRLMMTRQNLKTFLGTGELWDF